MKNLAMLVLAFPVAGSAQVDYTVSFEVNNGDWVAAEGGGGGPTWGTGYPRGRVVGDRSTAGPWETFILIDLNGGALESGDSIRLRTYTNGLYFCADGGGGGQIMANRVTAGYWETYVIEKAGGGTISDNDDISLKVNNGKYIAAEYGGGSYLVADRTSVGAWETFKIELSAATAPYWSTPAYSGSYWNSWPINFQNNCYNYAVNRRTDSWAQPGTAGGYPISALPNYTLPSDIALGLEKDGLKATNSTATSPEGWTKIYCALWYDSSIFEYVDFHFYRLDSDGKWSGKPGSSEATNLDYSDCVITNPATCDRGPYTTDGGYWFVPVRDTSQGQGMANVK